MWYDVTADRYWHHDFDLDTRRFSTFGDASDLGEVRIGPGADITVTTPHPEALRLVGLNRMDEITPEMDVDVVIAKLCANLSTKDPSEDGRLRVAEGETSTLDWARTNRANWLGANTDPPPRRSPKASQ